MTRRAWSRLILGLAIVIAIGLIVAASLVEIPDATRADKQRAFLPYTGLRIGTESWSSVVRRRTALVVAGFDPRPVTYHDNTLTITVPAWSDGGCGHAAIVAADGYLLTAAHVVQPGPLWVVLEDHGAWVSLPAQIIWQGDARLPATDHALLQVAATQLDAFTWGRVAPDPQLPHPSDATTIGSAMLCACTGFSAGHLRRVTREGDDFVLLHDIPLARGDSGSPLVDLQGRLLGLAVDSRFAFQGFRGEAVRPSPSLVMGRIALDRARRRRVPAAAAPAQGVRPGGQ